MSFHEFRKYSLFCLQWWAKLARKTQSDPADLQSGLNQENETSEITYSVFYV